MAKNKPPKLVLAVDGTGLKQPIKAVNSADFVSKLERLAHKRLLCAYMLITPPGGGEPYRLSVLGDGWELIPDRCDVGVQYDTTPLSLHSRASAVMDSVWATAGIHHAPLGHTGAIIADIQAAYGIPTAPPSWWEVRNSFIRALVWRDLHFILRLNGGDACIMADSSPCGDNEEITSFQVGRV